MVDDDDDDDFSDALTLDSKARVAARVAADMDGIIVDGRANFGEGNVWYREGACGPGKMEKMGEICSGSNRREVPIEDCQKKKKKVLQQ